MSAASGSGHCPRHPGADRDWTSADYAYYMDCNRDARADGCDPDGAVLAAAVQGGRLAGIGIKAPTVTDWPPVTLTAEETETARRELDLGAVNRLLPAAALRKRADQLDEEIRGHEEAVTAAFYSGAVVKPSRPADLLRLLAAEFRAVADLADENGAQE